MKQKQTQTHTKTKVIKKMKPVAAAGGSMYPTDEVFGLISQEEQRQVAMIGLIPSENARGFGSVVVVPFK